MNELGFQYGDDAGEWRNPRTGLLEAEKDVSSSLCWLIYAIETRQQLLEPLKTIGGILRRLGMRPRNRRERHIAAETWDWERRLGLRTLRSRSKRSRKQSFARPMRKTYRSSMPWPRCPIFSGPCRRLYGLRGCATEALQPQPGPAIRRGIRPREPRVFPPAAPYSFVSSRTALDIRREYRRPVKTPSRSRFSRCLHSSLIRTPLPHSLRNWARLQGFTRSIGHRPAR